MAPYALVTSLLLLYFQTILCYRYGSRSETLHIPEVKDDDYYGKGFQTIVRDELSENFQFSNRVRRDVTDPDSSNIAHLASLNDSHYMMIIHWAGETSDVIVALTKDIKPDENSTSNVYVSNDYGESFKLVHALANVTVDKYYNSPVSNSFYVFTDIIHNMIYITMDYVDTFEVLSVPFTPRQLSLHPTDATIMLAYDEEDTEKRLWLSRDSGRAWETIEEEVKSFNWGNTTYDQHHTLYVERDNRFADTGSVIKTNDFFRTSQVLATHVVDFQLINDYMFVSKRLESDHVELWVSYKRNAFVKADFPYNSTHRDYYVADASEEQVFLCIYHNKSTSHLYISDVSGLHYSLSLRKIIYFNNKYRNDSTISWLREKPFADVYRVDGIRGFYIASQFNDSLFSLTNQRSLISFNKGASWEHLQAPSVDAYGNLTHCHHFNFYWHSSPSYRACSLHLAQNFHLYHPQSRTSPILSKKSAIGLVMATGTLGSTIGSDMNVYVSNDGGIAWREAFKGTYYYAFGDYGGLIVAVRQMYPTGEIYYSVNEGETWTNVEFSRSKLLIYGILSEPGEKTRIFSVFGSYPNSHQWIIIKIDLKSVFPTVCGPDDYKEWSPSESYKVQCLLGQDVIYSRRRAHSNCYNGGNYEREISYHNCSCSTNDYECDEGFRRKYPWTYTCEIDPDSPLVINAVPRPCPEGTYYKRTKGYRRIAGDTCQGGVEARLEPDRILCPVQEQDEFVLYTTRTSIHKRFFTNQRDETLPLTDLQDVVAVEFDYQQNCLYWADMRRDIIQKVCLYRNSSRVQTTIIHDKIGTIESLALDWMSNILYWVDSGNATIEMARTDGSHRRILITNKTHMADNTLLHIEKPRSLVVYPKYGMMFWSEWSDNPSITSSYMDGTNIRTLVRGSRLRWPNGLAIDDLTERLYWTDGGKHGIYSVDLRGRSFQVLVENALWLPHPYSIAIYKNDIYWTDWNRQAILRTGLQSHERVHVYIGNVTGIMDMKIMHYASQQGAHTSPCSKSNGACQSICVERPFNATSFTPLNRTCLCSDIFQRVYAADGSESCECEANEVIDGESCKPGNGTDCAADQFKCLTGKCIHRSWKCDRDHDCGPTDDSDERDCPYATCPPGQFTCDNNRCIPIGWKCDHDNDCGGADHSDEPVDCVFRTCTTDQFACDNGRCVSAGWRCDGDDDCHDGSDENGTYCLENHNTTRPSSNYTCNMTTNFECDNYICIPNLWKCDMADDCGDNSDEIGCFNSTDIPSNCSGGWLHQCTNGPCIQLSWLCDGAPDCPNGEDETSCGTTVMPVSPGTDCNDFFSFDCHNKICVTLMEVCDGVNDCGNMADEDVCGYSTTTMSPTTSGYHWPSTTNAPDCRGSDFLCNDDQCIFESWVCDGYNDCKVGEDEQNCNMSATCRPPYFKCRFGVGCVPSTFVCDGDSDCSDNSDEIDCKGYTHGYPPTYTTTTPGTGPTTTWSVTCPPTEVPCDHSCIDHRKVCDGYRDCFDGSDEQNCHRRYYFSNFAVQVVNSTSLLVRWGRVKHTPPAAARVKVMYRESKNGMIWHNKTSSTGPGNVLLTHLLAGTHYNVTVAIDINGTIASFMPIHTVMTYETAPDPPELLHLAVLSGNIGHPELHVTWAEPTNTNGQIKSYTVYAKEVLKGIGDGYAIQRHIMATSNLEAVYTEFVLGTEVSVWVTATNVMEGTGCLPKNILITVPNRPYCTTPLNNLKIKSYKDAGAVTWTYSGNMTADHVESFRLVFVPKHTFGVNITKDVQVKDLHPTSGVFTVPVQGWSPGLTYLGYIQAHNASGYSSTCFNKEIIAEVHGPAVDPPKILNMSQDRSSHEMMVVVAPPGKPSWYDDTLWEPEVVLYYTDKADTLTDPHVINKKPDDLYSVKVAADGVVHLTGLLACNQYVFSAQMISPLVTQLGTMVRHITEMDESAPPKHVSVEVIDIRSDSKANVNVTFTTRCETAITDMPLSYVIRIQELWPNQTVRNEHGFPFSSIDIQPSHLIKLLHRGATYAVSVMMDELDASKSKPVIITIHPHRAPSRFTIFPIMEDSRLFLQWSAPKPLPTTKNFTYGIYHAQNEGNYTLIANISHEEDSYLVKDLAPSMIHKFKVRMENIYGYPGQFTPVETFTTPSKEKWAITMTNTSHLSNTMLSEIVVPCVLVVLLLVVALTIYVLRHKRLQRSFLSYANSHYDTRSGTAHFSSSDDLEEESQPMIQGFSDDEPLIVA